MSYLFSYFTGNGESGLHLAESRDGYVWERLGGSERAWLRPEVGEARLMRDPFLTRGPNGTFHLVWTTAWDGVIIGHAASRDLLAWTPQRALPVMADTPGTRNCWAPEMVWDAARGRWVIFWSSTVENRFPETADASESGYNHRLYHVLASPDVAELSPAALLWDPGFSVIDAAFALAPDGSLRLLLKDETLLPEPRKHLRVAHAASPTGPFTNLSPPFTDAWVEGPAALRLPNGSTLVYFDRYRDGRYDAVRTRGFVAWENVSDRVAFPPGVRHGSVLAVEPALLDALRAAA